MESSILDNILMPDYLGFTEDDEFTYPLFSHGNKWRVCKKTNDSFVQIDGEWNLVIFNSNNGFSNFTDDELLAEVKLRGLSGK